MSRQTEMPREPMNRLAAVLFSAVVLLTSGCSFVLVQGPPPRGNAGSCTVASNVPAFDFAMGVVEIVGGVGHYFEPLTVSADPEAGPGDALFGEEKAIGPWLSGVLIGSGFLHLLASREGSKRIAECNAGRRFGPQTLQPGEGRPEHGIPAHKTPTRRDGHERETGAEAIQEPTTGGLQGHDPGAGHPSGAPASSRAATPPPRGTNGSVSRRQPVYIFPFVFPLARPNTRRWSD